MSLVLGPKQHPVVVVSGVAVVSGVTVVSGVFGEKWSSCCEWSIGREVE